MALSQRLELRHSQALVMTPQLMQAIKLLQLSNLDLVAYVEGELERNPLLERASDDEAPAPDPSADGAGALPAVEGDAPAGDYGSQNLISEDLETSRAAMAGSAPTSATCFRTTPVREPAPISRRPIRNGPRPAAAAATTATTTSKPSSRPN
jgi:RNA polymerase sigma-54 factor